VVAFGESIGPVTLLLATLMRSLAGEIAVILVLSIVIVSAALAALPSHDGTWMTRELSLIGSVATFHFGDSRLFRDPVIVTVGRATLRSLAIVMSATLGLLFFAVPLGIACAAPSPSRFAHALRRSVDTVSSIPIIVWSTVFFAIFARRYGVILREDDAGLVPTLLAAIAALVLGDHLLADITRQVETHTKTILDEPYMQTVQAAGLNVRWHLYVSLVRPIADAVFARALFLIGGAIIAEFVFEIQGLGYIVVKALENGEEDRLLVLAGAIALVALGLFLRVVHRVVVARVAPHGLALPGRA
jgi:peptide/nickel transport system permease protein